MGYLLHFAMSGIQRLRAKLRSKSSLAPAEEGIGGERLIAAKRGLRLAILCELALLTILFGLLEWEVASVHSSPLRYVSMAVSTLGIVLLFVKESLLSWRFRLVISKSGLRYRKWNERRFREMEWSEITELGATAGEDITIKSGNGRLVVELGFPGRDELLAELAQHSRGAYRDPMFAKLLDQSSRRLGQPIAALPVVTSGGGTRASTQRIARDETPP